MKSAVTDFLSKETGLLELGVYEVSISSKLMTYVSRVFSGYDVDAEYNKHGTAEKKLNGKVVRPDIVVHERQYDDRNLLVIELKKKNKAAKKDIDHLIDFTDVNGIDGYWYDYGLFIAFSKDQEGSFQSHLRWFREGKGLHQEILRTERG